MKAAVVDLDNCVSDDAWRMHLCDFAAEAPNDRYWAYHSRCGEDKPSNLDVVWRLHQAGHAILIVTSRPEIAREATVEWLDNHNIPHTALYMRPNDNHDTSCVLKKKSLDKIRSEGYHVAVAVDDRIDVLDMYADAGVRICRRVFINIPEVDHP